MEFGSNEKPHDSESIGPSAPERLNSLVGKSSHYALFLAGLVAVLGVVSVALDVSARRGLVSGLTRDLLEFLSLCILVIPIFLILRGQRLRTTLATFVCFYVFAVCILFRGVLDVTDAIGALDHVPIFGDEGALHKTVRDACGVGTVCGLFATLYFLLLSLDRSYNRLKTKATRLSEEIAERKWAEKRETQLGRIVEESLDEILVFDAKTFRFLDVNRGARENLGYSIQELLAMTPLDVKPQVTPEKFMEIAAPLLNGERKGVDFETVLRRKDSSLYNVEAHLQLAELDNKPVFVAYVRDITERKRAERVLKDSQALFRSLVENLEQSVFRKDLGGRLTFLNQRYCELLGKPLDELLGKTDADLFPPERSAKYWADDGRVMETGESFEDIEEFHRPDGEIIYVRVTKTPVYDSDHKIIGTQGICWDVTKPKQTEELLRHSEQELRLITDRVPALIVYLDSERRYRFANKRCEEAHGLTQEQIVGRRVQEIISETEYRSISPHIDTALSGQPVEFDTTINFRRLGTRFIHVSYVPDIDNDGEVRGFYSLVNDITERKRAEEALRTSEARSRTLLEGSPVCIKIIDLDSRLQYMSTAGREQLKISDIEPFYGCTFPPDLYPEPWHRLAIEHLERAKSGEISSVECCVLDTEGNELWYDTTFVPARDKDRRIGSVIVTSVNITERRRAEEALRESEERFRSVFEQAGVAVGVVESRTGRFVHINNRYEDLIGYSNEEITQKTCMEITHPDDVQDDLDRMHDLGERKISEFAIEKRLIHKDGSVIWINLTVSPIWKAGEREDQHIVIVEDISERRKTENELSTIFEMSLDLICVADVNTAKFTKVNPAFTRVLGYNEEEFLGRTFLDFIHPDDIEPTRQVIERDLKRGNTVLQFENRYRTQAGDYRWLAWTGQPDPATGLTYAIAHDITERHRVETDLREHARQQAAVAELGQRALTDVDPLELIDEAVAMLSSVLDTDYSKMMELSPDAKTLLFRAGVGWRGEFVNRKTLTVQSNSQVGLALRSRDPVVVHDLNTDPRFRVTPALKEHDVTSGMTVVIAGRRQPFGILGVHTRKKRIFTKHEVDFLRAIANVLAEANERQQAEMAVRESEERYRTLLENHVDGVSVVADGKIVLVNRRICELTGYAAEELLGRLPSDFVVAEDRSRAAERIAAIADGAEEGVGEYTLLGKDGRETPIDVASRRIHYGGEPALLSVVRDISERKRALELAQQHHEELVHVSRLNTMGEMASGLAHELNQPLAAVGMLAETCLIKLKSTARDDAEVSPILEKIRDQTVRIGQIIHRLRRLVKKESFSRETIRVDEIIDDVLMLLNSELRDDDVAVDVQLPDDLPVVRGDTIQLEQVILNLVRNAVEAMREDESGRREIVLQASASERGTVEIAVRDTGPGMSEEAVRQVFDAFFTTKSEGMGMGLAICQSIIEAHGGKISISNNSDRGVTFRIALPQAGEESRYDI
jgi:PAS domain S-box-containing protein